MGVCYTETCIIKNLDYLILLLAHQVRQKVTTITSLRNKCDVRDFVALFLWMYAFYPDGDH